MKLLSDLAHNIKLNEFLFGLLLITFPFGSYLLSFSIGFMTIYPFLVLVLLLTFFGAVRKFFPKDKIERYYILFLAVFLLTALLFLPFINSLSYAIIDIRSIALMIMTSYVVLSLKNLVGYERWKIITSSNLKIIFFLVVSFCAFEFLTGIHIQGQFTERIIQRGLSDEFMYTPIFLWDNPNNMIVYLLLIGSSIIMLEPASKFRSYLTFLILFICFFFSYLVMARVGIILSLVFIFGYAFLQLRLNFKDIWTSTSQRGIFINGMIAMVCIVVVCFSVEKFTKIPLSHQRIYSGTELINPELETETQKKDTSAWSNPISKQQAPEAMGVRNSKDERKALILNGVDFFVQSHFLGVGPGQYRYLHDQGKIKYYAFGNNGAHFWFVELISQFGLLVFLLYLGLLFWIAFEAFRILKKEVYTALMILGGLLAFCAASVLPSAFLILDINWIFTSFLVVIASNYAHLRKAKKVNG